MSATWTPLEGARFGAALTGADLAALPASEVRTLLHRALVERYVIVVRGQRLSEGDHAHITESLGAMQLQERKAEDGKAWSPVHLITNLDAEGKPSHTPYIAETFFWHTDMSHKEVPVSYTLLYALELPPTGGETQFSDMYAAYDALPEAEQRRLSGLQVVHSRRRNYIASAQGPADSYPTVVHPLVRVHPESGRRCLYVGLTAEQVVGMGSEESRALLDRLITHATQPRFVYSHRWTLGDLVIWDNRCLMHRAARDYEMDRYRRTMRRSSVAGIRPIGVGEAEADGGGIAATAKAAA